MSRTVSFSAQTKNGVDIPYHKYLLSHPATCDCAICKHPTFQHLLFEVAVLYCRTFYIKAQFQTALAAFEHTHRHYSRMVDAAASAPRTSAATDTFVDVQAQAICRLYVYHAHALVRVAQPQQSADMIGLALEWWSRSAYPDEAIEQDLLVQQIALEQMQQQRRTSAVAVGGTSIDRWPQVDVAKVLKSRATVVNAPKKVVVEAKSKTRIPKTTTATRPANPVKPLSSANRIKPSTAVAKPPQTPQTQQRINHQSLDDDTEMSVIERSPQQSPVKSKKTARKPSKLQSKSSTSSSSLELTAETLFPCKRTNGISNTESSTAAETTNETDPPKRVTRATRANARSKPS